MSEAKKDYSVSDEELGEVSGGIGMKDVVEQLIRKLFGLSDATKDVPTEEPSAPVQRPPKSGGHASV